jgi:hypothetical protein
MIVNSQNTEFAYELISALPYAYYLHSKGMLEKTISGIDTECLYYFSPNHEINEEPRSWYNTPKAINIPNIDIHKPFLKKEKFLAPPLKEHYKNDRFKFKKEIVIICNRHNVEWGKKPINFFSLDVLRKMFDLLKNYQIIYINIEGKPELYDNAPPITMGDYDLLKEYPDVINIHELHKENKDLSFNMLQLMLFANCEKYITMNGGHSVLAAYFGGENIIFSRFGKTQTRELNPGNNSFYRWYHEFGGQRIKHVENETKLLSAIKSQWIDKEPIVNILIRTSKRPNYFKNCINSVLKQTYKNINIFVGLDSNCKYTTKYPVYPVHVKPPHSIEPKINDATYGAIFPYNEYFNQMQDKVSDGIIMYLDDDDEFANTKAIANIVKEYKKGKELIFWKVKSLDRIIPSDKNWKKRPVNCDISGIGFAFDSKYKNHAKWEPYKRGDFRIANKLYDKIKKRAYINEVLTQTQNGQHAGANKDLPSIKPTTNRWYITSNGGYWLGDESIGNKKILKGEMKLIDIKEVPKHLIKTS